MKKQFLFILLSCAAVSANAQDTLRNFNPVTQPPAVQTYSGVHSGYYTGHNSLFDEEWAEKYYINGSNQVKGVIAYHAGTSGTYTEYCEYKVYSVGTNGLPNTELAKKAVSGSSLDISGAPVYTAFSSPVNVQDSFFVSFNLGDYAHHSPGTKKIALKHGPDGSRATSDTLKYGRNAIRWHDHDNIVWKDFYKDNSTRVRTHFAIFPVVTLKATSVHEFVSNGSLQMHAIYPNPSLGQINLLIKSQQPVAAQCHILDQQGRTIRYWTENIVSGEHTISSNITDLSAGQYVLLVHSEHGKLAQTFIRQ